VNTMTMSPSTRKRYFVAIAIICAALELYGCIYYGLHYRTQMTTNPELFITLLVAAVGITVCCIRYVGVYLKEQVSGAVQGVVISLTLTIFFFLLALGAALRK
jgi:hypothetical protein